MPLGKQKIIPSLGMNMDSDESVVPASQSPFIKNHINTVNNIEDGNSGGQSTNILTPYPSIDTDFDDSLLPRLRSYSINLSAVTFPSVFISFVIDTKEYESGSAMANSAALDTIMTTSGFTITGAQTYSITDTALIYQKVIFHNTGASEDYYRSALFTEESVGVLNGNNICIGSYYDLKLNQMIWFNYNDAGRHNIQLYNANTEVYQTVLETPILNFSLNYRISSIDLVQAIVQTDGSANTLERLLYWTDKTNPPRKINIDRAIGNEYWNHSNYMNYRTDDEFMCLVKYPPQTRITGFVFNEVSTDIDYINGAAYQFRQNFTFDDGEHSTWSDISSLVVVQATQGTLIYKQFLILRLIDVGSSIVSNINLAYRLGNFGDWRQFATINRENAFTTYIDPYTGFNATSCTYLFYNDNSWSILDQADTSRLYDKVPLKAGCQEFLDNNILALADNLEDYDNLSVADIAHFSISNTSGAAAGYSSVSLKGGGTYQFGVIMYDEANRSSFVQTRDALKITVKTLMQEGGAFEHTQTFNFGNFVFPDWVKKVAICRTQNLNINRTLEKGFIQWAISSLEYLDDSDNVVAIGVAKKVRIKIDGLDQFNTVNYNQTTTTYQFVEGDQVTIITANNAYVNPATYGTITKQLRSTDGISLIFDMDTRLNSLSTALSPFSVGDFIEISTPNQATGRAEYYEVTPQLDIDSSTHKYTPNTYQFTGIRTTWDTYFIVRTKYPLQTPYSGAAPDIFTGTFEHHSLSDTVINSEGEDIGRINVVNENAGQLWYQSLVRYSMPYVQDTFINGLSTFDSGREKTFFRQYGNITRMYCEQFNLCLIQEEKAFRVMVNRNLITSADGGNTVTLTNDILSDALEIQGNFGCQNGETFIGRQGQLYWWDLKRGAYVGGNFERVEDISALYDKDGNAQGIQTYALKQSKAIFNNNSDRSSTYTVFIHAGFDPKLNQVIFTNWKKDFRISPDFQPTFYNNFDNWSVLTNDTVAFKTSGYWAGFYSFTPENYSLCEGHRLGNALVSFKEGVPYFHNLNNETTYLNFYGTVCDKYFEVVCNEAPDTVKNFMNISLDSKSKSVVLSGTKYEAVSVKTSNNMTSVIPLPAFQQKEGIFWSNFYRNTSLGKTIITGDFLKGTWIKTKFKGDTTKNSEYNEVRGVVVSFTKSEYTN